MIIKYDPKAQLIHQINNMYVNGITTKEKRIIDNIYPAVLEKMELSFLHIHNKYYQIDGNAFFNPLHVSQWTRFLYEIAHHLFLEDSNNKDLCDKIYGICKMISSADLYYEVKLPSILFFDHPQGSVIGRAEYGNYFSFSQGCTVGNNKGKYPYIGEHVSLKSGSKILGNCHVGDHVIMAANSYIIDTDVPSYSIVFGMKPNLIIHNITETKFKELTKATFID